MLLLGAKLWSGNPLFAWTNIYLSNLSTKSVNTHLSLDAAALSAGVYNYTLYVDDQMISTKQIIRN